MVVGGERADLLGLRSFDVLDLLSFDVLGLLAFDEDAIGSVFADGPVFRAGGRVDVPS